MTNVDRISRSAKFLELNLKVHKGSNINDPTHYYFHQIDDPNKSFMARDYSEAKLLLHVYRLGFQLDREEDFLPDGRGGLYSVTYRESILKNKITEKVNAEIAANPKSYNDSP